MGLDQYAFAVEANPENTTFSYSTDEPMQIAEWRKHPNLQGWMENLFNRRADAEGFVGKTEDGVPYISTATVAPSGSLNIDGPIAESMDEVQAAIDKMQQLSKAANFGKKRVFNCQSLRLSLADLDQLEMAVKLGELPSTQGFFFGEDSDEYYKANDLHFIEEARRAIAAGYEVYYYSWW